MPFIRSNAQYVLNKFLYASYENHSREMCSFYFKACSNIHSHILLRDIFLRYRDCAHLSMTHISRLMTAQNVLMQFVNYTKITFVSSDVSMSNIFSTCLLIKIE